MARYKPVDRSPKFIAVVLDAQIQPGSFEYALDYLIDNEIDLSALHGRYDNDEGGAPAYDPAVMLKIVLLAYSRGLISSRAIERACRESVLFMAICGDSAPQFTTIARFVRDLGPQIESLFTQVLLTCDAQGLIGRHMFAIDGVKLSGNASKERSGTFAQLAHNARRMERAVKKMIAAHQARDGAGGQEGEAGLNLARMKRLQNEAARTREFLATHAERKSAKGKILKSNVTDNDSAKMATSKGVIQGYTGVAAVDSAHQVIVAALAHGSGSEQSALVPTIAQTDAFRTPQTLITADAGYHSETNLKALHDAAIPALVADGLMRKRDERFAGQDKYKALADPLHDKSASEQKQADRRGKLFGPRHFNYDRSTNSCICPAGQQLYSNGSHCTVNGRTYHKFTGTQAGCGPCKLRAQCLRHPDRTPVRQVAFFHKEQASPLKFTERMKQAIDSPRGRRLYSRRMATVEPVR